MADDMRLGRDIFGYNLKADQEYKIKEYDFKKPDKFSKDQIRTLSIMHETFSRLATTSLSASLRSLVHVHVAFVDQLTYEEFIRSMPNPTTMAIIQMSPLIGAAVLEIDPAITSSIIDRLFGGKGEAMSIGREHSDIEAVLLESVFGSLIENLHESWTPVLDLRPQFVQIETNPQFAQIVPPTEMVVLIGMKIKIGEAEGMINFCIPYITIKAIMSKLTATYIYSTKWKKTDVREAAPELLNGIEAESEICVSGVSMSLSRLGAMKEGDRVYLPDWKDGRAFVRSGGASVLNLRRQENSTDQEIVFAVEAPIITKLEFLKHPKAGPKDDLLRIEEPLAMMSGEIKRGFESLQKKVSELSSWMESATDQMAFSGAEKEIPEIRTDRRRPFSMITRDNVDSLAAFIGVEHPQLIAMILSYLSFDLASSFLGKLPEEIRPGIIQHIGTIDRIAPGVIQDVERALEEKLKAMPLEDVTNTGGVDAAVGILNYATRSIEKQIIETLEIDDPDLAEEIKKRMFVFEDIVLLDPEAIPKIYKAAGPKRFAVALKGIIPEVYEHIFKNLRQEDSAELASEIEGIRPMRLSDVEATQQQIVDIIKGFDESGEIVVARADEKLV